MQSYPWGSMAAGSKSGCWERALCLSKEQCLDQKARTVAHSPVMQSLHLWCNAVSDNDCGPPSRTVVVYCLHPY
eukprot:3482098-Amphidinium_carterae.2